jgi:mono/diheme cytochrome c family protein
VEVARENVYREEGYLPQLAYHSGDPGEDLFRHACRSCHTLNGYRALAPKLAGTDRDYLAALVAGTDLMRGNMPPFWGTREEAEWIADHLLERIDDRPLAEVTGLTGVSLGERVFRVRCGRCHVFGGRFDNRESLVGLEREEYEEILDNGSDFDERMPDFTGSHADREALLDWLLTLNEEGES